MSDLFKNMPHKAILLIVILWGSQVTVMKAKNCSEVLTDAQKSYDEGHMYGIPELLSPCLKSGFSKKERIRAYRLLTLTYLVLDEPENADDSYLKILKLDPEYTVDKDNDPIELIYLSKKFKTTPILSLNYGKLGFNGSNTTVIHDYGVGNTDNSTESYKVGIGFQIGTGLEINLRDHWVMAFEAAYALRTYRYQNKLFNLDVMNFKEILSYLDIPLYLKYYIDKRRFQPYLYSGLGIGIMFASFGNAEYIDKSETAGEILVTGPSIDTKPLRQSINKSFLFGLGTRYRVRYNYFSAELRWSLGLNNVLDIKNQYGNGKGGHPADQLLYRYAYVSDDFRLNSVSLIFGYTKLLYKPRKVEKGETRRFFRNIFKRNGKS